MSTLDLGLTAANGRLDEAAEIVAPTATGPGEHLPTADGRAAASPDLTALCDRWDLDPHEDTVSRPSAYAEEGRKAVVAAEDAPHDDHAAGGEAVPPPDDVSDADETAVPESQPEWGVAPDDCHAGSSDETAGDEGFRQPDISGGEADGAADSERPESEGVDDSDAAGTPSPDGSSEAEDEAAAASCTDDAGEKAESPQPYRRTPLPSDVDWRDLKPRCYGNALPPLDSSERQGLKTSIVNRGFLGKILIDEWLAIIDGNTRWEICREKGIAPDVEVIEGLSDEEKEELAFSFNADRRQLKDPEVEQQVLDARFENLFKLQEQDPKKWTQDRIADALGVSRATVSARLQLRHIANGGNMSKPDARRRYEADIELEAVRLVKEGMPPSTVARMLLMHPKAVQRAVNKEKRREAGGAAAKGGKSQQVAAPQQTEDLAASDGVPEPHRSSLKHLNKDATAFTEWLKSTVEQARKDSAATFGHVDSAAAAADDLEKLNKSILYHIQRANLETARLRQIVSGGGEAKVQEAPPADSGSDVAGPTRVGDCLRGIVELNEAGEVSVALPVFGGGVIDDSNDFIAMYGPPEAGRDVRVGVAGFDRKRGLWKLQPLGRQTAAPPERTAALGTDLDEGSKTDAEDAACEADAETTEVSA